MSPTHNPAPAGFAPIWPIRNAVETGRKIGRIQAPARDFARIRRGNVPAWPSLAVGLSGVDLTYRERDGSS